MCVHFNVPSSYAFYTAVCLRLTWKTLGALTSEARAEERVAEKVPAMMRGPNPETMVITWGQGSGVRMS